ncbi:MAG: pentapeptide repeat-containing protein [bacterium]|nr:pentapeptide repeat-containing protein [bacterium]
MRSVLSGAVLSGADLSGADLSGADLSGADLLRSVRTLSCACDAARSARSIASSVGTARPCASAHHCKMASTPRCNDAADKRSGLNRSIKCTRSSSAPRNTGSRERPTRRASMRFGNIVNPQARASRRCAPTMSSSKRALRMP